MSAEALQIGLIGVGHRAKVAKNWEKDGRAKVVAGADINDVFLEQFRSQYHQNTPLVTKDYRELIARDDIDAVGVFTPENFHYEPTVAALQAGKHVFVEKPMAIRTEHCDEMLNVAKESGKKLMVGMNMRYMDQFRTLKQIIESGELAEVKAIWMRHFLGNAGFAWFHDYRASRKGSNSMLLGKGSHDIDMIHFLTNRYTKRVSAMGALDYFGGDHPDDLRCEVCEEKDTCPEFSTRDVDVRDANTLPKTLCVFRKEVDIEDHAMVLMDMGDMRACYLECHYASQNNRNYLVVGTRGQAELSEGKITVTTQKANRSKAFAYSSFARASYEIGQTVGGHGGADPRLCKDFLDLIFEGKETIATPEGGRMAVAVGCAAVESLRNGNIPVDVSPCPS